MFNYNQIEGASFALENWYELFIVKGPDAERFLNGQLSSNTSLLKSFNFQTSTRLNRGGQVVTSLFVAKKEDLFEIIVPKAHGDELIEDLNKYIIMDDVEIEKSKLDYSILLSTYFDAPSAYQLSSCIHGEFASMPAYLYLKDMAQGSDKIKELSEQQFLDVARLRGAPLMGHTVLANTLVTNTSAILNSVSLDKGCFLGQETVSKIESRRGASHMPVAFKLKEVSEYKSEELQKVECEGKKVGTLLSTFDYEGSSYQLISLLRNYRVENKDFDFKIGDNDFTGTVHYLPVGGEFDRDDYCEVLYELAVEKFQNEDERSAITYFKEVLKVNPMHENTLESIGVIYGRIGNYKEGIELMDKVLEANPDSIMAHTNKSLFFMNLGKIEEAEEEKAQATVKSFSAHGKAAADKRKTEELDKQKSADQNRRLEMFEQVLELDAEDELANFGKADIYFERGRFEEAIDLLKVVLQNNKKYSVAYNLLGKSLLKSGQKIEAKEVFEKGIEVASSQGDMMPANEMQQLLGQIS